MTSVVNINDVLDGHVSLEIDCIDRLLLNAYVPNLQVGGQVVTFLTGHLGFPIPSPALLEKIGNRFRREVKAFATEHAVPILILKKPDRTRWDDRKLDHVRPYLEKAEAEGRTGVVAIVQAQEFQWVFSDKNRSNTPGLVSFDFVKEERRVGIYYFYILDAEFGPGFIKFCTYFPYPGQGLAERSRMGEASGSSRGSPFRELANGFASCEYPRALQAICDRFGPCDIAGFFDRWTAVSRPRSPLTTNGPATSGSCRCARSRCQPTLVFDDPRRAQGLLRGPRHDNVGIGRPEQMAMVFAAHLHTRRPRRHEGTVPHQGVFAGYRGEHGLHLQAQPRQAVPDSLQSEEEVQSSRGWLLRGHVAYASSTWAERMVPPAAALSESPCQLIVELSIFLPETADLFGRRLEPALLGLARGTLGRGGSGHACRPPGP